MSEYSDDPSQQGGLATEQVSLKSKFRQLFLERDTEAVARLKVMATQEVPEENLWKEIGIHRTIGGQFFRNFVFMLLAAIISTAMMTFVLQILIPYPTSKGYYDIGGQLFSFVFLVFDVGTAYGIEIFISREWVRDKKRALLYIQYYLWYQMFTGLIQVTFISWWILTVVPSGNLAHLTWILLFINIKQYPGMLGTFKAVLQGVQRYDKSIILDFIGNQGFQLATQIIFFIGGRYWGMANPIYGEMLGLSIGMVLGLYVDDFAFMALGYRFFAKVLKQEGFDPKIAWRHDFDWPLVKECLIYGIGVSWAPMIGVGIGLIKLTISLNAIPGYANWIVLSELGLGIGGSINMGDINTTSQMGESLQNKKYKLASFYLSEALRYWAFIACAMAGIIMCLIPILSELIGIIPAIEDQYGSTLVFIWPGIILLLPDVPTKQFERIILADAKVWFRAWLDIGLTLLNLGIFYWAVVARIWEWGMFGIIILFGWTGLPGKIIKFVIYYVYVNKKIMKIRISGWQVFGASVVTFFVVYALGMLFLTTIAFPLMKFNMQQFGREPGAILTAVIAVVVIILVFMLIIFPLTYALAGGWDEAGLEILKKSYELSGPSKIFIKSIWMTSIYGSRISPLYNKFKFGLYEDAKIEADELWEMKMRDEQKIKAEIEEKGFIDI